MKRAIVSVVFAAMLLGVNPLCADEKLSGYFPPDITGLESFERGVTTADEIVAVLGDPVGGGASILPPDYQRREIFFYQQVNVTDMQSQREATGSYIQMEMEQSILVVLLLDGKFDGFMWYTSTVSAEGLGQ